MKGVHWSHVTGDPDLKKKKRLETDHWSWGRNYLISTMTDNRLSVFDLFIKVFTHISPFYFKGLT